MSIQNGKNGAAKSIPTVREVLDRSMIEELVRGGMTLEAARQEVEESNRMADRFVDLLGVGYTEEQIEAMWKDKTPQEILAEPNANGTAPTGKLDPRRPAQREGSVSDLH